MSLTVAEKTHWKTRIAVMVQRKIDMLLADKPDFLPSLEKKARANVDKRLGLDVDNAKIEALRKQVEELNEAQHELEKAMQKRVLSSCGAKPNGNSYYYESQVKQTLRAQNELELQRLLEQDTLGKQIIELRSCKDDAMDAVWLATSDKQIVKLWQTVEKLLSLSGSKLLDAARALIDDAPTAIEPIIKPKRSHKKKVGEIVTTA